MSKNEMWILDIKNGVARCLKICVKDVSWLRHLRLGHLNFDNLNILSNKQMVHGLPSIDHLDQLYKGCILIKNLEDAFHMRWMQSKEVTWTHLHRCMWTYYLYIIR